MNYKLKPCPFCGGKAKLFEDKDYQIYSVTCTECDAGTNAYGIRQDAIEAWNGRVQLMFTPDELDAIRRMFDIRRSERELSKIGQSIIDKCDAHLKGASVE